MIGAFFVLSPFINHPYFRYMEPFDQNLLNTIAKLADYFALTTVQKWTATIKRKKIVNTGQLLRSLNSDVTKDLGRLVVALDFAFEEYGRYIDIKNKRWRYLPPIDDLLLWVEKKGLSSFGADPNPNKKKPKSPERRINEIAWGIAKQRVKRRQAKDKAKPWFQSSFYRSLQALQDEINLGVQDRTIDQMKETLAWRLKRSGPGKFVV
jgi:hypothetical protein